MHYFIRYLKFQFCIHIQVTYVYSIQQVYKVHSPLTLTNISQYNLDYYATNREGIIEHKVEYRRNRERLKNLS